MFKNTFQSGFLSVLYSIGSKPLQIWNKQVSQHVAGCVGTHGVIVGVFTKVRNGHIKRITDNDIQSLVLEIVGTNVRWGWYTWVDWYVHLYVVSCSTTFITCPADAAKTLGIKLPFLVMIIKNLKKYFTFEVQVNEVQCKPVVEYVHQWVGVSPSPSPRHLSEWCTDTTYMNGWQTW